MFKRFFCTKMQRMYTQAEVDALVSKARNGVDLGFRGYVIFGLIGVFSPLVGRTWLEWYDDFKKEIK